MKSVNKTQVGSIIMLIGLATLMTMLVIKSCSKVISGREKKTPVFTMQQKLEREKLVEL